MSIDDGMFYKKGVSNHKPNDNFHYIRIYIAIIT